MSVLVERRCPRDCSLRAAAVVRAPTTATEAPAAALWAVLVQARRPLTEPVGRSRRPEQQAQAAVHRERPVHRAREGPEAAPTGAAGAGVKTGGGGGGFGRGPGTDGAGGGGFGLSAPSVSSVSYSSGAQSSNGQVVITYVNDDFYLAGAPADITVAATSSAGAVVSYTPPVAEDPQNATPPSAS